MRLLYLGLNLFTLTPSTLCTIRISSTKQKSSHMNKEAIRTDESVIKTVVIKYLSNKIDEKWPKIRFISEDQ
jgi:hypothetical protein